MSNIFTAQSGNYSQIASLLTPIDGDQFLVIVEALSKHAQSQNKFNGFAALDECYTLQDYALSKIQVNLSDKNLLIPSIASLVAAGLVVSDDFLHIGISILGVGFYQYCLEKNV